MMSGFGRMVELAPRNAQPIGGLGAAPIVIGAVALVLVLFGIGSIALWRSFPGNAPETDRAVAARQLQAKTAQVSEALVEKTKGLEATQQESIDQLQTAQDELQTMRRQLAAQQADTKKLADQVAALTEAVESLRQSFASTQANDQSADDSPHKRSGATRTSHRRHGRSHG
jgi:flagellar motility protein MotE (MotC chaperone)